MSRCFFGVLCVAALVTVAVRTGETAEIKFVTEYRYPTSFEVTPIMGIGSNGVMTIVGGVVAPRDFETREVGVYMSVEATVANLGGLAAAGAGLEQKRAGTTDLMLAAASGDAAKVRVLLGKGAMVNTRNSKGSTALMGAAAGGFNDVVNLLLGRRAIVNSMSNDGYTALMFAAKNGNLSTVNILLRNGADPNLKDESGATALMYAVNEGYKDVAESLIASGARSEVKDSKGTTPLMLANRKQDQDLMVLLTRAGTQK
jgi:hypothetical protein